MKVIKFLFGETNRNHFQEIMLILLFFVMLFSATLFFFDHHKMIILGYTIYFPVGLLFFPATYVISNIIQDRKGRVYANTVVASGFLADTILVGICWLIAHAGDRADYASICYALPLIMGATFIFLGVSSLANTCIYESTARLRKKSIFGAFIGFFASITVAEFLVTSMSMPLLFYKQGLHSNIIFTIIITLCYKISFNLIATVIYTFYSNLGHNKAKNEKDSLPDIETAKIA